MSISTVLSRAHEPAFFITPEGVQGLQTTAAVEQAYAHVMAGMPKNYARTEFGPKRLIEPASDVALCHVEGPERYTPLDVADAFGDALGAKVDLNVIPPDEWEDTFIQFGFSRAAARSYACMTATVVNGGAAMPEDPVRGLTTLRDYTRDVVGVSE